MRFLILIAVCVGAVYYSINAFSHPKLGPERKSEVQAINVPASAVQNKAAPEFFGAFFDAIFFLPGHGLTVEVDGQWIFKGQPTKWGFVEKINMYYFRCGNNIVYDTKTKEFQNENINQRPDSFSGSRRESRPSSVISEGKKIRQR